MTSKPSATNCPKAFECDYFRYVFLMVLLVCDSHLLFEGRRKLSGGYSGGVPPLPIPNREVKPAIADGTAPPGGRVGSCRSSKTRSSHDGRVFFDMPVFCGFSAFPIPAIAEIERFHGNVSIFIDNSGC